MMRHVPNNPSVQPALGPKKPKKNGNTKTPPKVVVVSEGKTELDYMEALARVNHGKYVYSPYKKETFDIDLTDKNELLNLLDAQVRYMQGHMTPYCYAT